MEVFARIIDLPETQCLLMLNFDNDEESYKVDITVCIESARVTMGLGFKSLERAREVLESYSVEQAAKFYEGARQTVLGE